MAADPGHSVGFCTVKVGHTTWEVPTRYTLLAAIGAGSYGTVCSAYDQEKKQNVAIKKVASAFQTPIYARRTYRELRLLRHMHHDNVLGLLDVFTPQNNHSYFEDIYFVTDLMGCDLFSILMNQKDNPDLTAEHVKRLIYQMLRGLKYIHSAGVIHRDLKPGNIAVNENCELRILDFGLAREVQDQNMTGHVTTRSYRAPEIILNWEHYTQTSRYTQAVDIWSVGCIMGEILSGAPLFPGKVASDQLSLIFDLLGTPSEAMRGKIECEVARTHVQSLPSRPPKNFKLVFPDVDEDVIDLLTQMLELDPDLRITAEQALAHKYFDDERDEMNEPLCESPFQEPNDGDESYYRQLVANEIQAFRAPSREV